MTNQSNRNDQEQAADAVLEVEVEASSEAENGKPVKRRGRAARRRRRAELEVTQDLAVKPAKDDSEVEVPRKKDAPTPSRRQKERRGIFSRVTNPVTNYFNDTIAELKKVTWSARDDTVRLSGIVVAVTAIAALSLGLYNYLLDIGLGVLLELIK